MNPAGGDFVMLARTVFLVSCIGATVGLWQRVPLADRVKKAAAAAGILHFLLSLSADLLLVHKDVYAYGFSGGLYFGVPVDLHLAWACLWGCGVCLLWEAFAPAWRLPALAGLILFTFSWDWMAVNHGGVLRTPVNPDWWQYDLALLCALPLLTIGFFKLILSGRALLFRAAFYALAYFVICYVFVPTLILELSKTPLRLDPNMWPFVAAILLLVSIPGAWAAFEFARRGGGTPLPLDPTRELVTTGPYAYVRNPMQISGVLVALILAAVFQSIYLWVYVVDIVILLQFTHPWEEAELTARFGKRYTAYAAEMKRWLPRGSPYRKLSA